jgi:hypothetical protein
MMRHTVYATAQIPAAKSFLEHAARRALANFGLTLLRNRGYHQLKFALITRIQGKNPL